MKSTRATDAESPDTIRLSLARSILITTFFSIVTASATSLDEAPFTRVTTGPVATQLTSSLSAAWGDFDNDGWLDLYVGNQSLEGAKNLLYRNNRDGTFSTVTNNPVATDLAHSSHAAAWADFNNDGWLDLVVANLESAQPNAFYGNQGGAEFKRMTATDIGSLATDRSISVSVAWADYDSDGNLDLFVANGALLDNQRDALYHNDGKGQFTRVLNHAITSPARRSTQGAWSDFDNDGDMDLLVTHSGDQGNTLFRNDGLGQFTDVSTASGLTARSDSVGAAWGDFDNDGDPDLLVTNLRLGGPNTRNLFYRNKGDGTFEPITTGEIAEDSGHFFSCAWIDYDNDGWLDLFLTVPSLNIASANAVKNRLYHNQGDGTFAKITRGAVVTDRGDTAGAAWGDYDNDGFPDLFVCFGAFSLRTNALYHNDGNANHWIKVRCVGTTSNRSAIGTKIRVKAMIAGAERWQLRQITGSEGWLSFNGLDAIIGLGDATRVSTLRVEWPSGFVQEYHDIPANQTLTLVEKTSLDIHSSKPGAFALQVHGPRQQPYHLEASPDLSTWSSLTRLVITNLNRSASFEYRAPADQSRQFFRAIAE